jgi:hypothetical protein
MPTTPHQGYPEFQSNDVDAATVNATALTMIDTDIYGLTSSPGRNTIAQLEWVETTDIVSGATLSANLVRNVSNAHNFTVSDAASLIEVRTIGAMLIDTAGVAAKAMTELLVDEAGLATEYPLGADWCGTSGVLQPFGGCGARFITNPGVGTWTIRVRCECDHAAMAYLRAATLPLYENLRLEVVEHTP